MDTLTPAEVGALHEALDDEYQAWTTYDQVLADFGAVRPFSNIRAAEARHIDALSALFARYGLPIPPNRWPGKVRRFADVRQACEAGAAAEIANGQLYERLLASTARPEILAVLRNLQSASQQRHLPAFRRCAQRTAAAADPAGRRRHRGGAP